MSSHLHRHGSEDLPTLHKINGRSSSSLSPEDQWLTRSLPPLNPSHPASSHDFYESPGPTSLSRPTIDMIGGCRCRGDGIYPHKWPPDNISPGQSSSPPSYEPYSPSFQLPSASYGELEFTSPATGFPSPDQVYPTSTAHSNTTSPELTAREFVYMQPLLRDGNFPHDPGPNHYRNLSNHQSFNINPAAPSSLRIISSGYGDILAHGLHSTWPISSDDAFISSQYVTSDIPVQSEYENPPYIVGTEHSVALQTGSVVATPFSFFQSHNTVNNDLMGIGWELSSTLVSIDALVYRSMD